MIDSHPFPQSLVIRYDISSTQEQDGRIRRVLEEPRTREMESFLKAAVRLEASEVTSLRLRSSSAM